MEEQSNEPGPVMKFVQDYRLKMLIPELLVVFGVWYFLPILNPSFSPFVGNVYQSLGIFQYFFQPLYFLPSGMLVLATAFTLHGIYPLDNYHEGKIPELPKAAVVMIIFSFILLPVLVAFQMLGYYMTEMTEFISRNPFWERIESVGDLLFYAGPMFFVGLQWWLLIPVFFLSQGVDGIHKIAHHETSSEKITWIFYFLWPISMPFFFDSVEIMAMVALSIPAFAFYSYIRPYYTYVTSVHTLTFAMLLIFAVILSSLLPLMNIWFPGFIPPHIPPRATPLPF
ncbi:MAG: hypothetical protein AM325_014685 [Candidatus Thorarchaeota archaeon SMTZ1-45]|nr:MAG: hypothetical protein AM325_16095 [Candidatus Thorarchaeota archaeon SMTZ1-45]